MAEIVAISTIVPPNWYYQLEDIGDSIVLKVGAANPPTTVVAEVKLTGTPDFSIGYWLEFTTA